MLYVKRLKLFPIRIYVKEQQPKYFVLAVVLYIKILRFSVCAEMVLHRGYLSFRL